LEAFATEFPTGNHIPQVTSTEFSSGDQIPKVTFAEDLTLDLTPSSIMIVNSIQKQHSLPPFCVLFDSGSDTTFIHERCLPPGATATVILGETGQTLAGQLTTTQLVHLCKLILPECSCSSRVDHLTAYGFNGKCDYDIIFGRDFLRLINMTQDFANGTMSAFGTQLSMKQKNFYNNPFTALSALFSQQEEGENFLTDIKKSKYEKVDVKDVIDKQSHLTEAQRKDLLQVFAEQAKLFSGMLGKYPFKKMEFELLPDAKTIHGRPYPIPCNHLEVF
jgi:hypothetical protein